MTTNEAIALALRDFAKEFVHRRKADVAHLDLQNTKDLFNSLYAKVNADPARANFMMNVYANTYGRFQDMRRRYTNVGGPEMLEALKMWADKEGLGKFNKGKYSAKNAGRPPEQIREAIAWGILRKLRAQNGTRKRPWWNKGKTHDIDVFYDHLLRVYQEAIAAEVKKVAA